jgi:non-ribosomal peptide synthetase component F
MLKILYGYGPTETTVVTSFKILKENDTFNNIGKSIYNLKFYILDKNLKQLSIGIIGELYIGGEGLSRGYLNRNDLTNERFILIDLKKNNSKLCKTGDLARFLENFNLSNIMNKF